MNTHKLSAQEQMGIEQTHLATIGNKHFLHKDVVKPFDKLRQAAAKDGVDVQVCSSFRSFEQQLSIWNRKWLGELPLNTLKNTQLNASELSSIEKVHAIMLWSAMPGASRHHWGSDFDVYDHISVHAHRHSLALVPSEYEKGGPCEALSKWIVEHAAKYEFYLPYAKYVGGVAQEPWHLSYKPVAINIQKDFVIDELYSQLEQADILGKNVVLKHLPSLVKRYTFNLGPST